MKNKKFVPIETIIKIARKGGMTLTKSVLRDKLINEFYLFKSKKNLRKLGRNNISNLNKKISFFLKRKEIIETFLDGDKITRYY